MTPLCTPKFICLYKKHEEIKKIERAAQCREIVEVSGLTYTMSKIFGIKRNKFCPDTGSFAADDSRYTKDDF